MLAALLRCVALDDLPPGLHQDEAANAWNAYCLLKTGRDQHGVPWPIFYIRALGENRSALFCYLLLPIQFLGGLNTWTTRLPAALGGVLTVALLYWVGARLFGRNVGLFSAALLTLNPTHIQMSRWGHEASLTPLLTLAPLAALLWARWPLDVAAAIPPPLGRTAARPTPPPMNGPPAALFRERGALRRGVMAGALAGASCYGYPAVRLYLPLFLAACVLLTWPAWRRATRPFAGAAIGFALTFGPLAIKHLAEPETIGRRAQMTWVWTARDDWATRAAKVARRYAAHFGTDFLFLRGDMDQSAWTVPFGFLPRYCLPLLLLGAGAAFAGARRAPAARLVLAGALLYPAGDALNWHVSLHALRSSAGLPMLMLLAALGLPSLLRFLLARRMYASVLAALVALSLQFVRDSVAVTRAYLVERPRKQLFYYDMHRDVIAACRWLRPHLDAVDAVVLPADGPGLGYTPYLVPLFEFTPDPEVWLAEPREVVQGERWDRYVRSGKFYFLPPGDWRVLLQRLRSEGAAHRVLLFLRDNDPGPGAPVGEIRDVANETALWIYDYRFERGLPLTPSSPAAVFAPPSLTPVCRAVHPQFGRGAVHTAGALPGAPSN